MTPQIRRKKRKQKRQMAQRCGLRVLQAENIQQNHILNVHSAKLDDFIAADFAANSAAIKKLYFSDT